jgi:hypothetical protein
LDGWGTGIRQPNSAEIRAISRSESLLERLTGVIGVIRKQFREGIVVPADAEQFIEQCDSVGQQLEEAEGAHGGISKTLGGGIIDDEPVGVGIGERRMASVHHFGDFSGRGDFGLGEFAERFRTAFRCENHCSFSIGCHRAVSWEGALVVDARREWVR